MSLARDKDLARQVSRFHKYLWERSDGPAKVEGPDSHIKGDWPYFVRELFSRLYSVAEPPELKQPVEWAKALHDAAQELPEWESLKRQCSGKLPHSVAAAASVAKALAESKDVPPPPPDPKEIEQQIQGLRAAGVEPPKELLDKLKARQQALVDWSIDLDQDAVRRAWRKAVQAGQEAADQAEAIVETFGLEPGTHAAQDPATIKALFEKVAANPKLKQIAELAGRLRRLAQHKQATKASRAASEITSIEQGADVARLLPQELLYLRDKRARLVFYRRFLERQTLQYRLEGQEVKAKGPVIVLVDVSGSMSGHKEAWAKAMALALLEVARIQKRGFALIYFDSEVQGRYHWPDPSKVTFDQLAEALSVSAGGGTDFDPPLAEALELLKQQPWHRADIIIITDGEAALRQEVLSAVNRQRQQGLVVFGILVEGHAEVLHQFCDHVYDGAELAKAEQEVLAL